MSKRFLQNLKLLFSTLDLLIVNFSLYIFNSASWVDTIRNNRIRYLIIISVFNIVWLLLTFNGFKFRGPGAFFLKRLSDIGQKYYALSMVFITFCCFIFYQLLSKKPEVIFFFSWTLMFLVLSRLLYEEAHNYFKTKTYKEDKVVFIGYNPLAIKTIEQFETDGVNKKIIGFFDKDENVNELSNYPVLSNLENVIDVCKQYGATEIYSTLNPDKNAEIFSIINQADKNCIRFKIISAKTYSSADLINAVNISVAAIRNEPLQNIANRIAKRLSDLVVSSLVIVFINSWLIPIIGILIRMESKGPIFFKQLRSGKNNKTFCCYKFRSMCVNTAADSVQATRSDSRITKVGRFLRRTNLDEFPQFFNVLIGDMSIVGPRPHMIKHTEQYSALIDSYMVRHFIKPGITGWAQVNGFRGETKDVIQMQQRIQHDIWYMENWSLLLDLKVIFLTAFNTLKGESNAF